VTLIALTVNHGSPILMADILFSSRSGDENLPLPTLPKGVGKFLKDKDGYKPFALKQKLYIVHDRLSVALGGRNDQMLTFYNRLRAFIPTNDFTEDELRDYILNYPADLSDRLDAIILASIPDGGRIKFKVWHIGNVKSDYHDLYGDVFAAGSGTAQFLGHVSETKVYEVDNSIDAPLLSNLSLIGYWIGNDYVWPDTIQNHWGAGYELVIFKDNKFIKLDQYVVVVMAAEIGDGIEFISRPINTIMINYQGDDLVLRSFSGGKENIFGVPPIYTKETHFLPKDVQHHFQNLLGVYVVKSHYDGKYYCPSFALTQNVNEFNKTPIKIERTKDQLIVGTSRTQDRYMHDHLLSVIKKSL